MPHPLDLLVPRFGSQAALARELGVGESTVSMWRRNGLPDAMKWRLLRISAERGWDIEPRELDWRPDAAGAASGAEAA